MNHHYYTIFIPEDYKRIVLEIHGFGFNIYSTNGKEKINRKNNDINDIKDLQYNNNRIGITFLTKALFNLSSFKNQYISFSFFRNDTKLNKILNYYFRVLHTDSINDIIIYPLDSNIENACYSELILKQNSCYFLLKNDYNELSHNLIINELYDNAENFSKEIISKKEEDYYSINLTNKGFDNVSLHLNIDHITIDSYVIIKINSKFNYKPFLTISSDFNETEPSIQIYSYKLVYLLEQNKINFNLDDKARQQFKLRIINNMPERDKLETTFFINNTANTNINNNYGKQFSCLIEKYEKLEFSCKKNLIIYVKFDYKRERKKLKEISYQNFLIPTLKEDTFPIIFYIKDFYNNGLDFNIYSGNKYENLDIIGYVVDYLDIEKLDEYGTKEYVDYHNLNKGIYDKVTQTGVIEFNKLDDDSKINYKDIYYIIEINSDTSNYIPDSKFFIFTSPKENSGYTIPSEQYIRGIFNLTKNDKQQSYYTEPNTNLSNNITIIELSSNYKNVEISNYDKFKLNKSETYVQVYRIEGIIHTFTVKLKDNDNITINNSPLIVNYIFKYYYSDINYNPNYSSNVNCSYPKEVEKDVRKIKINCNNNENNSNLNYSYALRIYQENNKAKDEELITLAITSSEIFYFKEYQTKNSTFNFIVNDISENIPYLAILFIKYVDNNRNIYKVYNFAINISNNNNIIYYLLIIIITVIIIFMILMIILIKTKKKNKELEEKVRNISFKVEDNDIGSSDDELNNRVSYVY